MRPHATLVVNPASAAGATGRRLDMLRAAALRAFDEVELRLTRAPGDAARLASQAAQAGARVVVAVGGDGTASEVASGLCGAAGGEAPRPALALIPAGTGCDLARTLGMPRGWDDAFDALRDAHTQACDVVAIDAAGARSFALNMVTMGVGGDVVAYNTPALKRLGGRISFLVATVRAFVGWPAPEVELRWEGPEGPGSWRGRLSNAFIANGAHCGGGMKPVGAASMCDGILELVIVPHLPILPGLRLMPRLYDGTLGSLPGMVRARVTRLEATLCGEGRVGLDVDGERGPSLPLHLACLSGALPVLAPRWRVD